MSTTTSRVFVVNEPLKVDHANRGFQRMIDITPATQFGELVYLTPSGPDLPRDPEALLPRMRALLASFGEEDYLLPIGHPLLIGWACALAARASGGRVRMLEWKREYKRYVQVPAQLWSNQNQGEPA